MSKELTLEELAASSKPAKKQPNKISEDPNNGAIKMSPQDIENAMIKSGKIKPKTEDVVDAPIVENAFKAMDERLQRSKEWIQNEMMPIVMKNAEEMALENEMNSIGVTNTEDEDADGTAEQTPVATNNSAIPDIDESDFEDSAEEDDLDLDKLLDDDTSTAKEMATEDDDVEEAPKEKHYAFENVELPEQEEEPKKNPKVTEINSVQIAHKEVESDDESEDEESADLDALMKDLDDDSMNVVDTEEETPEETRARFKKSFNSVPVTSNPIDFSKFKITKKAMDSSLILNAIQNTKSMKKADWGLYHTGRSVTFTECYGPELDNLQKTIRNSNGINGVIASLRFVYDHIEDANKPKFESWCKLIRTEDIESLYFGLYRANYSNTNLIARICPTGDDAPKTNCGKTSLIDTNIDDMVKYGSSDEDDPKKIKKEFMAIVAKDTTTENTEFESTLMQVSDDIVISYSPATLYSTFIQYSSLKPEITQKYSDILNTMAYIDGFFHINRFDNELVPIEIKEYPKNFNKTILAKLKVYTGILKSLTSDQYNVLTAKLENLIQAPKVHYVYPECKCPECGATIQEEPIDSVLQLLFTRAQLAQIKSL